MLNELDVVKVVSLLDAHRHRDRFKMASRSPRVGDIGTIVFVHVDNDDAPKGYAVECVDDEGKTIWLTDFTPEELELINRP